VSDLTIRVQSLHLYPVKSCAGVEVGEALLIETGFDLDRTWMVIDPDGQFVSQREQPRMALIQPTLKTSEMILRAPGMLALHIALDGVEERTTVSVWGESMAAYDMGALSARWFSDFLGTEVRLARFDPEQKRLSDRAWTGEIEAENAFQDGFPLLVASTASLAELNRRLSAAGEPAVTMARFRPNIVLDGLDAHGEDGLGEIDIPTDDGAIRLRLVKPCTRCPIPDVDPATGVPGHAVGDALATYRKDPRRGGGVTFGMNAVVVEGIDHVMRRDMSAEARFRFD